MPKTSDFLRGMMRLSPEGRTAFLESLPPAMCRRLRYTWELWARPEQLWRPGSETYTVALAGRGWGKGAMGSHAVSYVSKRPELCGGVIGIAGRTTNEVNRTMVHGDSGVMACYPPGRGPRHFKSDKILEWKNGVIARLFSGEEPESFRGPNIGFLWADEFAHWTYVEEAWKTAQYVLRIGEHARALFTTTPIGVSTLEKIVWEWDDDADAPIVADDETPVDRILQGYVINGSTRIISGDTYENAANLSPNFLSEIVSKNEGTALADQEIRGQILRGVPDACWRVHWIRREEDLPDDVEHVVVAVDPSGSADPKRAKSAEVGIVVLALSVHGVIYVIEDCSGRMDPEAWGRRVWEAVDRWGADAIAAEDNFGGDMVRIALKAARPRASTKALIQLVHATRDKQKRAGLTTPLYQAGRVRHCGSPRNFVHLERQMTSWDPTRPKGSQPSPDRMDALVWGILYLVGGGSDRHQLRALNQKDTWAKIAAELKRRAG